MVGGGGGGVKGRGGGVKGSGGGVGGQGDTGGEGANLDSNPNPSPGQGGEVVRGGEEQEALRTTLSLAQVGWLGWGNLGRDQIWDDRINNIFFMFGFKHTNSD